MLVECWHRAPNLSCPWLFGSTIQLSGDLRGAMLCSTIHNNSMHPVHVQVYVLKRLCRGLASSREGARQGFALALTAVLQGLPALGGGAALSILESSLESPGGKKVGAAIHMGGEGTCNEDDAVMV